jgi:lipopolysaccharide transport system permease protein
MLEPCGSESIQVVPSLFFKNEYPGKISLLPNMNSSQHENVQPHPAAQADHWDLEIGAKQGLLHFNFAEIWRYRDLLVLFVRRDFVSQYKQTILGPIWHLAQPLLTTIMFLLVFGRIAKIPTDGVNPILFYMSGIALWNYFSFSLISTSNTFIANSSIFGKVYFPRIIMPLSIVVSNIIRFGIQFILVLLAMIWFYLKGEAIQIGLNWLLIPVLILFMAGLALGLGIIISSLTTKYRDFSVLLTFGVQLAMYATPVAYPMSYLKNSSYAWLIKLNPLTALMEAFRYALFGKGTFTMGDLLYSFVFMVVALVLGFALFNKVEKTFMDTV